MINPLVSIIVPSYNHIKYIEICLNSIVNQTYKNIELIVIDDGSSDGSVEFLQKYFDQLKLENKKLILQKNQGAHNAINNGLKLATGEYVTILNSDDIYAKERLEILVNYCKTSDAKMVFTHVYFIDENGTPTDNDFRKRYFKNLELLGSFGVSFILLGYNLAVTSGNLFFHKATFANELFSDFKTVHDWDFVLRAMCRTKVHYLNDGFMFYRTHSSNTLTNSPIDIEDCFKIQKNYLKISHELGQNNIQTPNNHNYPIFFEWYCKTIFPELNNLIDEVGIQSLDYNKLSEAQLKASLNLFSSIRAEWFSK